MSNIIGSPFDPYVKSQIEARQKALGQLTNISADTLKYYTTKAPWLRLASTVNLEKVPGANSNTVLNKLVRAGIPEELIAGDKLAKNFILQGGTLGLNDDGSTNLKKGLNYNNELFTGAYGWGGIGERGFVPMPGITNASVTYLNNGALAQSEVTIKCFSKQQFQLLDVLYLRPGYTLLLEFGWSTFLNSNADSNLDGTIDNSDLAIGALQTYDGFKSKPLDFILNPGSFSGTKSQFQLMSLISEERKKYCGNYEAVYGKITNFKWNFESDGSYTCTVNLIGMGSMIESLKLNVSDPNKDNQSEDSTTEYESTSLDSWAMDYLTYDLYEDWSEKKQFNNNMDKLKELVEITGEKITSWEALNTHLSKKFNASKTEIKKIAKANVNNNPLLANKDDTRLNKIFYDIYQTATAFSVEDQLANILGGSQGGKFIPVNGINNGGFLLKDTLNGEQTLSGDSKTTDSVFIKFGVLLKIIEENCNLFTKKGKAPTPIIKFDFRYQALKRDKNFMFIVPPNISTNPKICIVPYNQMRNDEIGNTQTTEQFIEQNRQAILLGDYMSIMQDLPTDTELNNNLLANSGFLVDNNKFVGRIGNILVNLRFCSEALATSTKDDDGGISVLSFVKTVLSGINEAMGSINNFTVMHDESKGVIKIFDETPKPGLVTSEQSAFSKINVFGVKQDQGSFVKNISLNAEIPKEFATMIAIGAQASGNNLQGNATSFSNYNAGLIDRVIPEKVDYETKDNPEEGQGNVEKAMKLANEKIYYTTTTDKISPFASIYIRDKSDTGQSKNNYNFLEDVSKDLTENYTSYIKLIQGALTEGGVTPSPFFLPFNLNLEFEGLSGIKLYEKFRISDDILPPSYEKDSVDIIVKGINHSVNEQGWTTTLDTLSVPRHNPPKSTGNKKSTVNRSSNKQQKLSKAAEEPLATNPNEDIITRLILTRLVDNGFQTLGLLEVLDENGNTLYALPTVELPWLDNKNSKSCIPTGNYNIASRTSPKYGDCFIIANPGGTRKEILAKGGPITGYNTTNRTYVLIHEAPAAQGNSSPWLLGCMAPGFKFNTNQDDKFGNPRGTGPRYGGKDSKSYLDSAEANRKLIGTLYQTGKNPMFQMEIKALGGGDKPRYRDFYNDRAVQDKIAEIEDLTGEDYQY